jgi:phosphoglycerate dehydrogenase-like enzyme
MPSVLVTMKLDPRRRAVLAEALGGAATPVYLEDLSPADRESALRGAEAVLAANTDQELLAGEAALLAGARLIQFVTAGVDFVHLNALPASVPIASNGGAYAEAMAEHALAMVLAAAKRLLVEHAALQRGEFNQHKPTRSLSGLTCGIFGFGGIGLAVARLMRALGMRIHAVNRRGAADETVDWISSTAQLDALLGAADVLVISVPMTLATVGAIGARELRLMKPDAILVNLARGEIIDEAALFAHVRGNPRFTACIDAWWVEPVRHGAFRMDHPFLELPNVVGSPHNSASARGAGEVGLRRAAANLRRVLAGEPPRFVVGPADRIM